MTSCHVKLILVTPLGSKTRKLGARLKTRGRGPGVPGSRAPGVRGPEVWKTRGLVENTGSGGKHGVWWKTRGVSGKHGV